MTTLRPPYFRGHMEVLHSTVASSHSHQYSRNVVKLAWALWSSPVTSWMPWSDTSQLNTWQKSQPIPGLCKTVVAFKLGDTLLHSSRFLGSQIRTNSPGSSGLCSDLHSLSRYSALFCVCPSSPDSLSLAAGLLGPSDTPSSWHQPGFTRRVSPFLLWVTTTVCKERPSKYWRPNYCPDRIPTYSKKVVMKV